MSDPNYLDGDPVQLDARQIFQSSLSTTPLYVVVGTADSQITARYQSDLTAIQTAYASSTTADSTSLAALKTSLADLYDLVQNGMPVVNPASPTGYTTKVLNYDMMQQSNQIIASFKAIGFTGAPSDLTLNNFETWKSLAGIANILAAVAAPSLTVLLQNNYIQTANAQIYNSINTLNTQITTNQSILGALTVLQNYKNELSATAAANPLGTQTQFNSNAQINTAYGNATNLAPQINISLTSTDATAIVNMKSTLQGYYNTLLAANNNQTFAPGTVGDSLLTVINDLPTDSSTATTAGAGSVYNWMIDGQNTAVTTSSVSGKFQTNISTSISTVENLNDSQKQLVQNELFIYQEFFTSASSVMESINQSMMSAAQKIS